MHTKHVQICCLVCLVALILWIEKTTLMNAYALEQCSDVKYR